MGQDERDSGMMLKRSSTRVKAWRHIYLHTAMGDAVTNAEHLRTTTSAPQSISSEEMR